MGCVNIFADTISGTKLQRAGWEGADVIVDDLKERHVEFKSLRENIDTSSATGRAFLSIMGAVSQMELEIKSERSEAGRAAAKARGKSDGRPATDPDKLEQARILYQNSDKSAREVSSLFGFSRRTFFEYLRKVQQNKEIQG